jgi:hypothetical protein
MNTPTPPKCLSVEINDVTRSMIRLDQPSFAGTSEDSATPEQALTGFPDSAARLRLPNASGQKCENTGVPKPHIRIDSALAQFFQPGTACSSYTCLSALRSSP